MISKRAGTPRTWHGTVRSRAVESMLFLGAVAALQGVRFLFTLVGASSLGPSAFTQWVLFVTMVGYAPMMLLGVGNGLNRLVPLLSGRGDHEHADALDSAAWWCVGVVVIASLGLAATLATVGASTWVIFGLVAGSAMTAYQVQQFSLRARLLFNRASAQQWLWAFVTGLGCLGLFLSQGGLGVMLMIWTVGAGAAVVAGWLLRRPTLKAPSFRDAASLVLTGFPIMLSGLLGNLFFTADRWAAAVWLDPAAAGAYGLASLIASAVLLVPMVISQQHYPRLAMAYGADGSAEGLLDAARRQSLAAVGASLVMVCAASAFSVAVLPQVLPDYGSAALPAVVLSFGVIALAGATGYGNLLVVIGALWTYFGIQVVCLLAAIVLMVIGARVGGTIGLALGVACGQAILMVVVIAAGRAHVQGRAVGG